VRPGAGPHAAAGEKRRAAKLRREIEQQERDREA
jgi:hypothetical protein